MEKSQSLKSSSAHQSTNSKTSVKIKCGKCNKFYMTTSIRIHTCDNSCGICGKQLKNNNHLTNHIKNIHPDEINQDLLSCVICNEKFIYKISLDKHMKSKHFDGKMQQFKCDIDGKIFKTKKHLHNHMQCHQPTSRCLICSAEVKQASLKRHLKEVHSTEREFQCNICEQSFISLSQLRRHETVHDKKFQCEFCSKIFQFQFMLNTHIKDIHENPNSFACDVCDKKFSSKDLMTRHRKIHDNNRPKPFKCQRCEFAFNKKREYERHLKVHERRDEKIAAMINPVKCEKCPTVCKNKTALSQHVSRLHRKGSA